MRSFINPLFAVTSCDFVREKVGSGDRARTCNILVNSQTLYH
jgi:hypothetical protein